MHNLTQLQLLQLNNFEAGFMDTLFIIELIENGVAVEYGSLVYIDPEIPILKLFFKEVNLMMGDQFDFSNLEYEAVDLIDGSKSCAKKISGYSFYDQIHNITSID